MITQLQIFFTNSLFRNKLIKVLLTLPLILFYSGCGYNDSSQDTEASFVPSVEAVEAKYGSLPLTERLTGVVKAKNQVEIYPRIVGEVTEVYVRDGDIVKQGAPLVKLRDIELREQLKQANASLNIAAAQKKQAEALLNQVQLELNRMKALAAKALASDAEFEDVKTRAISAEADLDLAIARLDQAKAAVDEREENLSRTIVRAPVSGSVGGRNAEIGMQVNSNTKLFTIGELKSLKVEVVLTDLMLNYINVGQRSEIAAEILPGGKVESKVSRISPFLNPITHSTKAEIDIVNPDLKLNPGMFVTVDIFYGESEEATLVPLSALYENPASGITGVYASNDTISLQVKPGRGSDNPINLSDPVMFDFKRVEVIAKGRMSAGIRGLDPGDWVITLGHNLIGSDSGSARVNPIDWERVEKLQNLQSQDVLNRIMSKE